MSTIFGCDPGHLGDACITWQVSHLVHELVNRHHFEITVEVNTLKLLAYPPYTQEYGLLSNVTPGLHFAVFYLLVGLFFRVGETCIKTTTP